uniref:Uncharacterized protein n=1 Tax=Anguilla anguilla TaxID=7936 RepID=A0A0E9WED8_ANGAN
MQQRPMGLPALWKACRVDCTCACTEQSFPCTAQEHRFLATPNPPGKMTASRSFTSSWDRSWISPRASLALSTSTFLFSSVGAPFK